MLRAGRFYQKEQADIRSDAQRFGPAGACLSFPNWCLSRWYDVCYRRYRTIRTLAERLHRFPKEPHTLIAFPSISRHRV